MLTPCPDCDGEGSVEVSDRNACRVPDCCGGCSHYARCPMCDGTGSVESDNDDNAAA